MADAMVVFDPVVHRDLQVKGLQWGSGGGTDCSFSLYEFGWRLGTVVIVGGRVRFAAGSDAHEETVRGYAGRFLAAEGGPAHTVESLLAVLGRWALAEREREVSSARARTVRGSRS